MSKSLPEPLPPLLAMVVDLLRNDRENWQQYIDPETEQPIDAVLVHEPSGVTINIGNPCYAHFNIPEVGNFRFSGPPLIQEAAKLIADLGNQIRSIRALEYLKDYEEHFAPK